MVRKVNLIQLGDIPQEIQNSMSIQNHNNGFGFWITIEICDNPEYTNELSQYLVDNTSLEDGDEVLIHSEW